jgi:hypothetical protein
VVLTALGLAFFKLSIGLGTMLTYGSYFRENQNIPATATRVMLADLSVSLLAGIAIFPAVFAFGFEPAAGPSLVFMTIPAVFTSMPGGIGLHDDLLPAHGNRQRRRDSLAARSAGRDPLRALRDGRKKASAYTPSWPSP